MFSQISSWPNVDGSWAYRTYRDDYTGRQETYKKHDIKYPKCLKIWQHWRSEDGNYSDWCKCWEKHGDCCPCSECVG